MASSLVVRICYVVVELVMPFLCTQFGFPIYGTTSSQAKCCYQNQISIPLVCVLPGQHQGPRRSWARRTRSGAANSRPPCMVSNRWRSRQRVLAERLQQPHVEDAVEPGLFGSGHLPDVLEHLEGSFLAWPKLPLGPRLERVCRSMEETEPHPIPHRKLELVMVGVVVALGVLLNLEKTLANLHEEVVVVT